MASVSGGDSKTITLNVYPMMDVFSILITFLLMSFSTDPVNHDVNPSIELPESKTLVSLDELPSIVASKTEILVNDKKVATIIGGDVPEQERSQGAILALYNELVKLKETTKRFQRTPDGKENNSQVLTMEMDKNHRFQLMRRIMLSAQQAEFITFKLMVGKESI